MQFPEKLTNQTAENSKKPNSGPDFGPKLPHPSPIFFHRFPSYHPMQFKIKIMSQTWENGGKPKFRPKNFSLCVSPLLDVRYCYKLSLYVLSRKTNDPNSRTWQITSFWAWFRPTGPKFGPKNFSKKIWVCQSLDIMVSYQHVKYQRKTNDPLLRKLGDGWTE